MVQVSEVSIISIDEEDDTLFVEGEILFESDLTTPFSCSYSNIEDEFEELQLEITPGKFDKNLFKNLFLTAVKEFEF